jgi:hypothetical protein
LIVPAAVMGSLMMGDGCWGQVVECPHLSCYLIMSFTAVSRYRIGQYPVVVFHMTTLRLDR